MTVIKIIIILSACLVSIITDLKYRKVFNWLTLPLMIIGLVANTAAYGIAGLGYSLLGLLCGGLIFFPAFWLGGMGAGDIKLLAAVGAVTGAMMVLNAALYAALAGGLMALAVLIWKRNLWPTLKATGRLVRSLVMPAMVTEPLSTVTPFPYALAIGAGVMAAMFLPPLIQF